MEAKLLFLVGVRRSCLKQGPTLEKYTVRKLLRIERNLPGEYRLHIELAPNVMVLRTSPDSRSPLISVTPCLPSFGLTKESRSSLLH